MLHDEGLAFLRLNVVLARISVRLVEAFALTWQDKTCGGVGCPVFSRMNLQEWFLRPKHHATCQQLLVGKPALHVIPF